MQLTATGFVVRATRSARLARFGAFNGKPPIKRHLQSLVTSHIQTHNGNIRKVKVPEATSLRKVVGPSESAVAHLEERLREQKQWNKIVNIGEGQKGIVVQGKPHVFDLTSNLNESIVNCFDQKLYDQPDHPICITRKLIESVFPAPDFKNRTENNPVVSVHDNFDVLGFPKDHPGRSRTDTYYLNSSNVLRTHTSAYQHKAFQHIKNNPEKGYTICADVFRRDSIDRSHFPVFHQMEGAMTWKLDHPFHVVTKRFASMKKRQNEIYESYKQFPPTNLEREDCLSFDKIRNPRQMVHFDQDVRILATHLKRSLELLVDRVFRAAREAGITTNDSQDPSSSDKPKIRWVEAYFPFTSPSYELEVHWQGEWLELLGCGVVQDHILKEAGLEDTIAWAWGLGIERLAMLLFNIPDIRLFWSKDPRFLSQFSAGKITQFVPFSKYPSCYKDVAFWIPSSPAAASPLTASPSSSPSTGVAAAAGGDSTKSAPIPNPDPTTTTASSIPATQFHENDVMELVREVAGALAEDVKLVDEFVQQRTGRKSLCYRINYRSLERTLTNEEVNKLHDEVTRRLQEEVGVELR